MGSVFGKKNVPKIDKSKVSEQDLAILQLKQQRDKIKQMQKRVNLQLEKEKNIAKELIQNGKKEKALLILRKKKRLETNLDRSEIHLEQLEKLTQDLEFSQIQIQVFEGLKLGNESLKQLNQLLNVEAIEDLLFETREGAAKQEEISQLLTGSFTETEEEDLLQELKEMEGIPQEEEEKEVTLPEVPTDKVPTVEIAEEQEVKPRKERRKAQMETA